MAQLLFKTSLSLLLAVYVNLAFGQTIQRIEDIPTRPSVTQRVLVLAPQNPKAAVILLAGGHGGLQISSGGSFKWGEGNFLVRTRQLFVDQDLLVAVVDAPSDRQNPPYLSGFRQKLEHAADIKAVIAWLREQEKVPVWLVGPSRGTQSAAYIATELTGAEGPDGLVLTSTILSDSKGRPVSDLPLSKITIPVLVVHHEQDGCSHCAFSDMPKLMSQLGSSSRHELVTFKGGVSRGDPCEAAAYHGFNGLDGEVVAKISAWMLAK